MTETEITKMKKKTFSLLCDIRDLCDEHDINYFIVGGTLLGAIRHKGFIPWDDDIDVAMPRKDYERFLKLVNEFSPPVQLSHVRHDSAQVFPFVQVFDSSTEVVMDYVLPYSRGAWVDVFPIDGVFENELLMSLHWRAMTFLRSMVMNKTKSYYKRRVKKSVKVRFAIYAFLNKFLPKKLLYALYDWVVRIKPLEGSAQVAILYGRYRQKEIVAREVFESYQMFEFEGQMFRGPVRFDEYLTSIYGNYMEYPPVEKRSSGHRFIHVSIP